MRVLGVIPARGGSKGIPRKNLAIVSGKPLLAYSVESALAAQYVSDVIVSTEDHEIAEIARSLGAEVPFMRPANLAIDTTATIDVLVHLCQWMSDQGRNYDAICLLQPTSPQRTGAMIDECISAFEESKADSLITVNQVPHQYNPHWVYWMNDDATLELTTGGTVPIPQRQLLPPAFHRDGRIYLTKTQVIVESKSLFGNSVMGHEVVKGINIDTPEDLKAFEDYVASMPVGESSSRSD